MGSDAVRPDLRRIASRFLTRLVEREAGRALRTKLDGQSFTRLNAGSCGFVQDVSGGVWFKFLSVE